MIEIGQNLTTAICAIAAAPVIIAFIYFIFRD